MGKKKKNRKLQAIRRKVKRWERKMHRIEENETQKSYQKKGEYKRKKNKKG